MAATRRKGPSGPRTSFVLTHVEHAAETDAIREIERSIGFNGALEIITKPFVLPADVIDGLRNLAASADAGGPEDIGLAEDDEEEWAKVQEAIKWIKQLP